MKDLAKFGFSTYEAKAYIGLVSKNPVTGYELAKISGVPTAKIYETIGKLKERHLVITITGDPVTYLPVAPNEMCQTLRNDYNNSLKRLSDSFKELFFNQSGEYIFNIKGSQEIIQKAKQLISESSIELIVFLWDEEYRQIQTELAEAAVRNVKIRGVICGGERPDFGQFFNHGYEAQVMEEHRGRMFVMVTDEMSALLGVIEHPSGIAWTTNHGLIKIAKEYVKHEIYQSKIMQFYGKKFAEDFGKELERLRF
ncbi:MAG: TrmB family transcriptional regulator [Bacteroidota bacterium]